eukprot:291242_1
MGDGMYFQFVMAVGIWILGLGYFIVQEPETGHFYPFALLGGFIWSIGNVLTVPIIKMIGMALGLSIWSGTNLVVGWILGKYGWLGYDKDDSVKIQWLNYVGVFIQLCSLSLFFFVEPNDETVHDSDKYGHLIPENEAHIFNPNLGHMDSTAILNVQQEVIENEHDRLKKKEMLDEQEKVTSWVDTLSPRKKQTFGILMAIFAGCCYGTCFSPIQYLINTKHKNDPKNYPYDKMEQYAFCHYCGILISAIIYFILYCIYTKNKPQINNQATFPSMLCGFIWAVAFTGFFIAMDKQNLGPDTTFPIVSGSPQIVASLWGVLFFNEIKPGKNMLKLLTAILTGITAISCITASKLLNV